MEAWRLKTLAWMLQVGFYQNLMSVLQYEIGQKNGTEGFSLVEKMFSLHS